MKLLPKIILPCLLYFLGSLFPLMGQTYELIWADEFSKDGRPDTAKWFHQTQLPIPGSWYNGEIQHYTDRPENTTVQNGALHLTARAEVFTDQGVTKNHTSARLNSKFTFTYGRVDVRAKLPTGVGTWPAIWMLGKNIDEPGAYWQTKGFGTTPWPTCGEIDIMEHWGHNQDHVSSAIHTPSSFGATANVGGRTIPGVSDSFHTYSMEWTPDSLVFSVDGTVHYVYAPAVKNKDTWPFDAPQFLLLNVAILPTISSSFSASSMIIDYVRVYQATPTGRAEVQPSLDRLYPNPARDYVVVDMADAIHKPVSVQLYDLTGRLVLQRTILPQGSQLRIDDIGGLPLGTYQVVCQLEDQPVALSLLKL